MQALLIPVSICMMLVVITVRSITYFATNPEKQYIAYASIFKEDDGQTNYQNAMSAVGNALMLLVVVVTMTLGLVLLFKYNCYRAIKGWLIFSSQMLLMTFGFVYLQQVLLAVNYPVDWITVAFFIWNFSIVGTICIHWRGPLLLTQAYLIISSVLMALVFIKHLPPFTTWAVLIFVALYDIVAVLCPGGPLKMLVETAQERDEPLLPSLIYSTTMAYIVSATLPSQPNVDDDADDIYGKDFESSDAIGHHGEDANSDTARLLPTNDESASTEISDLAAANSASEPAPTATSPDAVNTTDEARARRRRRRRRRRELEEARQNMQQEQDEGVKLGLGDFIFYSVLIGKAAEGPSLTVTVACFYAILAGLCITLFILLIVGKALPALPISIGLGLFFYCTTDLMIVPMLDALGQSGLRT